MRAIGGLIGLALLAGPAWADGLAVKPGLWEATAQNGASAATPAIPPDQLAKMTPQQQAMVQQRLAAASAAAKPHRYCLTQAMISQGLVGPEGDHRCTRTMTSNTSTLLAFSLACTGDHPANGIIKLEAKDAQTIASSADITLTTKQGQTMPIHRTGQAHWVGDDCGDLKPKE